jgi:V8-like Glu-specific endopeptidase
MIKGSKRNTAVAGLWLLALTLSFSSIAATPRTLLANDSPSVEGGDIIAAAVSDDNLNIVVTLPDPAEAGTADNNGRGPPSQIDYDEAVPLPLPKNPNRPKLFKNKNIVPSTEGAGVVSGNDDGNTVFPSQSGPAIVPDAADAPAPEVEDLLEKSSTNKTTSKDANSAALGDYGYPFTTRGAYSSSGASPTNLFPWRAAGKLFFQRSGTTYTCTASLIKRGLLVTAAHCVAEYGGGSGSISTSFSFQPARYDTSVPYGSWSVRAVQVPASYLTGSDPCDPNAVGVVCLNDLAVLTIRANSNGGYPGDSTGWYGYAWNDYSFSDTFYPNALVAQVTQLGYPANIDSGTRMIRTDALGIARDNNQLEIGSAQGPGSSGGPWLLNFGNGFTSSDPSGQDNNGNNVIATTSWGYTSNTAEVQGASRFATNSVYTSTPNIVSLVDAACNALDSTTRSRVCN